MKCALIQQAVATSIGATQNWTDASITSDFVAALFFGSAATANDTTMAAGKVAVGICDGTNDYAAAIALADGSGSPNAQSGEFAGSILNLASGGTATWLAARTATLSNGITETYSAASSSPPLLNALLLSGLDIEWKAAAVSFNTTDTSKVVPHGCSGAPTAFIMLGDCGEAAMGGAGGANQTWGFYESVNGTSAGLGFKQATTTVPTDVAAIMTSDLGHSLSNADTDLATFSLSSIGATNLTLSRTSSGSTTQTVILISIRAKTGVLYAKAGVMTNPTTTGAFTLATGLGVPMQVLLTVGTRLTTANAVQTDDSAGSVSFGVACNNAGTIQQATASSTTKDNVSTSVAKSQTSNNKAMAILDNTGALQFGATATAFNSDGSISLNCTTQTNGTAGKTMYLAFGMVAAAAALAGTPTSSGAVTGALSTAIKAAAAVSSATNASAQLTNWSIVSLGSSLYTGEGSILSPDAIWTAGAPGTGNTVYYDGTYMTVAQNGETYASQPNFQALVQWFNGTTWSQLIVVYTTGMVGRPTIADAVTGALTTAIVMRGAATALAAATGSMQDNVNMAAAVSDVSSANAALTTVIQMAAAAVDTSVGTGALTTGEVFSGAAVASVAATASLSAQLQLLASATSTVASAAAALITGIQLAGTPQAGSAVTALLTAKALMAGSAQAQSAVTAFLMSQIRFAAPALTAAYAAASLSTSITMTAAALSSASDTAALTIPKALVGSAASLSASSAQLATGVALAALALNNDGHASGTLSAQIIMHGAPAVSTTAASADLLAPGSPIGLYTEDPFFVVTSMRAGITQRFPTVGPDEIHVLDFDFTDSLLIDETLYGRISVNVVNSAGEDQNPTSILDGIASYDPTLMKVLQPEQATISGNDYYFTVTAPTSTPNKTISAFGLLSVRG